MKRSYKIGLLLSIIAVVGGGLGLLVWSETQRGAGLRVRVEAMNWSQTFIILQDEVVSGEGWRADMEPHAFAVSCREHLPKGTVDCDPERCNPHEVSYRCRPHECNCVTTWHKIGKHRYPSRHCQTCYDTCHRTEYDTCYDKCPVYDDWCRYRFHAWRQIGEIQTASDDNRPHDPRQLELLADQRLEKTRESYQVRFTDGKKSWVMRPAEQKDFMQYEIGQYWLVSIDSGDRVWPIRRLELERE